jgi:diguanylate cyclase (GGDEF)-like protein
MNFVYSFNTVLGSFLVILLIIIDYTRKYNTDLFQRKFFLWVLVSALIAVMSDFLYISFEGRPGKFWNYFLYGVNTIYFVFQILCYYLAVVFLDYMAYKDMNRTKKFLFFTALILSVNTVLLLLNLSLGFYFSISSDNFFIRGDKYYIRLLISYFVVVMAAGDLVISSKYLKRSQVYLTIFFVSLTGIGAALDLILGTGNLIWPCLSAALLYIYFFIIQSDANLDSLTGIGNRYSFNQFIDRLSRQNSKQSYAIAMIDMDEFKKINDTFGHPEGDQALRDMAAIIKGSIRHSDFAARYGGDEFVLAIRAEYDIEVLLNRLRSTIEVHNNKNIRPYKIKISYGWDVFTTNSGQSIEDFLAHIDSLMYRHKAEQRRSTDRPGAGAPERRSAQIAGLQSR